MKFSVFLLNWLKWKYDKIAAAIKSSHVCETAEKKYKKLKPSCQFVASILQYKFTHQFCFLSFWATIFSLLILQRCFVLCRRNLKAAKKKIACSMKKASQTMEKLLKEKRKNEKLFNILNYWTTSSVRCLQGLSLFVFLFTPFSLFLQLR